MSRRIVIRKESADRFQAEIVKQKKEIAHLKKELSNANVEKEGWIRLRQREQRLRMRTLAEGFNINFKGEAVNGIAMCEGFEFQITEDFFMAWIKTKQELNLDVTPDEYALREGLL